MHPLKWSFSKVINKLIEPPLKANASISVANGFNSVTTSDNN